MPYLDDYWFKRLENRDDDLLRAQVAALPDFGSLNPEQYARIIYRLSVYHMNVLSGSGNSPVPLIMKEIGADYLAAAADILSQGKSFYLAKILSGFALMQVKPSVQFFSQFSREFGDKKKRNTFSPHAIAHILQAFARMSESLPKDLLTKASIDLKEKDVVQLGASFQRYALKALAMFSSFTDLPEEALGLADVLEKELQKASREASLKEKHSVALANLKLFPERCVQKDLSYHDRNDVSRDEEAFAVSLLDAGFKLRPDLKPNRFLGSEVDFAVDSGRRPVLLEYDGPIHFVTDVAGKVCGITGKTSLMSALIRQVRPDMPLVRVPYYAASRLQDRHFEQLHALLPDLEPDAYRMELSNDAVRLNPMGLCVTPARALDAAL